jgi:glutamate 5-kinase
MKKQKRRRLASVVGVVENGLPEQVEMIHDAIDAIEKPARYFGQARAIVSWDEQAGIWTIKHGVLLLTAGDRTREIQRELVRTLKESFRRRGLPVVDTE